VYAAQSAEMIESRSQDAAMAELPLARILVVADEAAQMQALCDMEQLIEALLLFSRLGRQSLSKRSVDVNSNHGPLRGPSRYGDTTDRLPREQPWRAARGREAEGRSETRTLSSTKKWPSVRVLIQTPRLESRIPCSVLCVPASIGAEERTTQTRAMV
jgi:hypothetical protein